jgi:hypothetical protein
MKFLTAYQLLESTGMFKIEPINEAAIDEKKEEKEDDQKVEDKK